MGHYFGLLAFWGYPTWWNNVPRIQYLYNNVSLSRLLSKLVAIVTLAVIPEGKMVAIVTLAVIPYGKLVAIVTLAVIP